MSDTLHLEGRHVVLGLSGGIACYKAAELARELIKAGATVQVVMTQAAEAWGAGRLWRELGVAAMTDPALARDGRRHDVVQVGLLVLALLLGRRIALHEYPDELMWLLQQATETEPDGTKRWKPKSASLADGQVCWEDVIKALFEGMQLLEDDYLGGLGTRGSGKVHFQNIRINLRSKQDHLAELHSLGSYEGLNELMAALDTLQKQVKQGLA